MPSREEQIAKAERLKRLFEDPDFSEAVTRLEQDVIAEWRASNDPETRKECHLALRLLERLLRRLRGDIDDGMIAAHQRDLEQRRDAEQ